MRAIDIERVMLAANVDPETFSDDFKDCADPEVANKVGERLMTWVRDHHPEHPLGDLRIIHIDTALSAAGIDPRGSFSPEAYAAENARRHGADATKWSTWLRTSNACHACDWHDAGTIARDLAGALDQGARVLVLHRLG